MSDVRNDRSKNTWKLLFLLMSASAIAYVDRVAISFGLIQARQEFQLTETQQGMILSAFSWGYVAAMFPGGWLSDRAGPGRILKWAVAAWGVLGLATSLVRGSGQLILARFALGVAEAPSFPASAGVIARAVPVAERGRATALFDGGSYVGLIAAGPIIGVLINYFGWRIGFAVAGAISVPWLVLARRTIRDDGEGIGHATKPGRTGSESRLLPRFRYLASRRPILCISAGFFCYNYVKSFFLTWFPIFLVDQFLLGEATVGLVSAIPPALAFGAALAVGSLTDRRVLAGEAPGRARRRSIVLGLGASSFIGIAGLLDSASWAIAVLSMAFAMAISASPGIWALPADLAPNETWVSTIGGFQNTFSNIAGIVAPIVTGVLVGWAGGSYTPALVLTAMIALVGALMYGIAGPLTRLDVMGEEESL